MIVMVAVTFGCVSVVLFLLIRDAASLERRVETLEKEADADVISKCNHIWGTKPKERSGPFEPTTFGLFCIHCGMEKPSL